MKWRMSIDFNEDGVELAEVAGIPACASLGETMGEETESIREAFSCAYKFSLTRTSRNQSGVCPPVYIPVDAVNPSLEARRQLRAADTSGTQSGGVPESFRQNVQDFSCKVLTNVCR
ncbi:MAG: hypothetical protein ABFS02_02985 [Pseudomonadota bacterium]